MKNDGICYGGGADIEKRFHIFVHHNMDNIHLKLVGDFDDLSACELNELIDQYAGNVNKIFIHTESLNQIIPIGKTVFHKRLIPGMNNIVFTGQYAPEFLTVKAPPYHPNR